ncbi:hypothetical protein GQ55_8G002100 [Panicum hallii var. hallii]|uniref:CCT domain-containing protein n=1 Tax=Panicum hallii var. hallii TaxID=1504633 RepID=A0A2T7CJ45_9POAL|nr:hypothetical protein GQ55_8G002100 [Panicum hallii var. hallii]
MLPPLAAQQPLSPASYGMAAATSPFRRAMSTGDLLVRDRDRDRDREEEQRVMAAPAPGRYSAEERRERIDKYRSKRNQRNFQKKITYACRKTLADSRPRVKGRFARNAGDGTEADADHHHVQQQGAPAPPPPRSESESEWWPAAQQEDDASIDLDDDMLAAYLGVSSISLYSPSGGAAASSSTTTTTTTLPAHHHHYS